MLFYWFVGYKGDYNTCLESYQMKYLTGLAEETSSGKHAGGTGRLCLPITAFSQITDTPHR